MKIKSIKLFAVVLAFACLLTRSAATAQAATWQVSVGNKGGCAPADRNCASIQAAIYAAANGDTVLVSAGTYHEHDYYGRWKSNDYRIVKSNCFNKI